jgi:hypothetical protein
VWLVGAVSKTTRSRYAVAASSGSMSSASRPSTPFTGRGVEPIGVANTSARLDAGSVLTSSTLRPCRARATAVADNSDVLPNPRYR